MRLEVQKILIHPKAICGNLMAQDCTSEKHHPTIDTIDEFWVYHPNLSPAIEILTIDGVRNLTRGTGMIEAPSRCQLVASA